MIPINWLVLISCLRLVTSAPVCEEQVILARKRVVGNIVYETVTSKVTVTQSSSSSTEAQSTSTNTVYGPLVQVLVSGDLTLTMSLTSAAISSATSLNSDQTLTLTSSASSQLSISLGIAAANVGGGIITSFSISSLIPSGTTESTISSSAAQPSSSAKSSSSAVQPTSSSVQSLTSASSTSTTPSTSTASSASSSSSASNTSSASQTTSSATFPSAVSTVIPSAIVYSPYNDDQSCKDFSSVLSDLAKVALKSIPTIRVYGTDCNYLSTIYPIATSFGLKINQGFWFNSPDTTSTIEAANLLVAYCQQNGWDVIDFITVGNEVINESYLTPAQLASVISTVGDILKQGGYTGDITTSEPPVSFERYPELCDADIDFVGINPHSYFDVSISASQAGTFVLGQKQIVENICKNKEVRITETGYPSKGNTNGLNVPSADNQRAAIKSILEVVGSDVTILTMYNDLWKQPGSYNVEQWFGAYDLLS